MESTSCNKQDVIGAHHSVAGTHGGSLNDG